jgi:hypothetical protein
LRRPALLRVLALVLALPLLALALAPAEEDAHTTGCLPARGVAACVACHPGDAASRFAEGATRFCSPYCQTCHAKGEMARHHNVGVALAQAPSAVLPLTSGKKTACITCHLLSRPRYDTVRWKAASLYDRMFRGEPRYKTYFLAMRNDQGQLCLSCH